MKRRPLRPGTIPLVRRSRLKATVRLKPENPARKARLRAEQFGPEAEWLRDLPCSTCPRMPPSEPSHVKTRKAGGKRWHQVPQCSACHGEFHSAGRRTFEASRPGIDLLALATSYASRWERLPAEEREQYEVVYRERWGTAEDGERGMP